MDAEPIYEGPWVASRDFCIAIRMKIEGHYHYGWIRLNQPQDKCDIYIEDLAY